MDINEQINTAISLQKNGKLNEAETLYLEILDKFPDNANVLNLFGLLNYQLNKFKKAEELIKKAIELNPCAYFYSNLGRIYFDMEEFKNAAFYQEKAIELKPETYDYWVNYAMALRKNGKPYEAIKAYNKAISINPEAYITYYNLGNLYFYDLNDPTSAANSYDMAHELNPEDDLIMYMLAESYIKTKDFVNGFKFFEIRLSREIGILSRRLVIKDMIDKTPIWNGEPAEDKTLYVYYEAAFGDTIMYLRYLPLLKSKFNHVIFKPQSNLCKLTLDSEFGIEVIEGLSKEKSIKFDYHIPLMSIPYAMKLFSEQEIPGKEGYLKANPQKVLEYKEKYFNNNKIKIGIKWQGNSKYDTNRKIPLTAFYKLFGISNVQFYSVQKGEGIEELAEAKDYNIIDLGDTFNDFADTAAALENMDLVICNDTSVGHLAGGLGKPCWMLLPYMQNWRWTTDLSHCIWYDSVKMFKQNSPGNWDEVFDEIYKELQMYLSLSGDA